MFAVGTDEPRNRPVAIPAQQRIRRALVTSGFGRLRHPAMSAQRSLTGGKRTLLGHRQIDAFDPFQTWAKPDSEPPACYNWR
jgi:hypothetical protein